MPTLAERMTAVKHALEVAIKRRRRTERLALLGGGNQGEFVTPSRPTYLGMSETPDSGVDTPATAARPVSDKITGTDGRLLMSGLFERPFYYIILFLIIRPPSYQARRVRAKAPEPPTMDETMGDAEQEDEEVETPTMKVTAVKSKSPAKVSSKRLCIARTRSWQIGCRRGRKGEVHNGAATSFAVGILTLPPILIL